MNEHIRKLKIEKLRTQLELCHAKVIFLAKEFETSKTPEEKADAAKRLDRAFGKQEFTRLALNILERQERQAPPQQNRLED